jgi:hypothetical protein
MRLPIILGFIDTEVIRKISPYGISGMCSHQQAISGG